MLKNYFQNYLFTCFNLKESFVLKILPLEIVYFFIISKECIFFIINETSNRAFILGVVMYFKKFSLNQ